jgi:hypothetical protein
MRPATVWEAERQRARQADDDAEPDIADAAARPHDAHPPDAGHRPRRIDHGNATDWP